jgi:integrase
MAEGITRRHSEGCPAKGGGRCRCSAGYEAFVYSARDGKKIRKNFAREAEAKSWRAEAKRALDHGVLRAPSRRTLQEAADVWLEGARRGDIRNRSGQRYKPATLRGYSQALDDRILPAIGSRKLNTITTADLQALVDQWQAEGHSASTIRNSIKPLQAIYRRARSREGLPVNPTHDLELPTPRPKEVEIISPEQAARLLAAAPKEDRALWATALYAGLRYGELRALRWGAVDLAGGTIRVRESWDPREGSIDPKTATSRRTVPVPAVLRERLVDLRMSAGEPDPEVLVFGREDGRPFDAATVFRHADRAWRGAELAGMEREALDALAGGEVKGKPAEMSREKLEAAVLRHKDLGKPEERLRLHQARHTYASFMIAAGINAKALSAFMGHSSIKVTFDLYGHLMPGTQAEAAALLDTYLSAQVEAGQQVARGADALDLGTGSDLQF